MKLIKRTIQYAKRDDLGSFLEEELQNRAEYGYPPSVRIVRHIFRSRNQDKLSFYLDKWSTLAKQRMEGICTMTDPTPAPLEKSEDFYRWHICYFTSSVTAVVRAVEELKREFEFDEDIDDVIDSDPISMM